MTVYPIRRRLSRYHLEPGRLQAFKEVKSER